MDATWCYILPSSICLPVFQTWYGSSAKNIWPGYILLTPSLFSQLRFSYCPQRLFVILQFIVSLKFDIALSWALHREIQQISVDD